jgi:hypothetical protein
MIGPLTGSLKIAVVIVCPLKSTLLGSPTFKESTFIINNRDNFSLFIRLVVYALTS